MYVVAPCFVIMLDHSNSYKLHSMRGELLRHFRKALGFCISWSLPMYLENDQRQATCPFKHVNNHLLFTVLQYSMSVVRITSLLCQH